MSHDTTTTGAVPARLIASMLVLGPVLMVLSVAFDLVSTGPEPRGMIEAYTASPGWMDIAATILHNGFLLLGLGLFAAGFMVSGRGRWLALAGGVIGGIAFSKMAGMVLIDWFSAAAGQEFGVDGAVRMDEQLLRPGLLAGWIVPQFVGSLLGPLLPLVGFARAGLLSWWVAAALPIAAVGLGFVAGPGPLGTALTFGLMLVAAALIAAAILRPRSSLPAAVAQAQPTSAMTSSEKSTSV